MGWTGFFILLYYKSIGVAVLNHKNIPFVVEKTVTNPEDRFIFLEANLYNKEIIIINVYASNDNHLLFFQYSSRTIS